MKSLAVIIAAGGLGNRFGSVLPKQFVKLSDGTPMIVRSMEIFKTVADVFVVSVSKSYEDYCRNIIPITLREKTIIVTGGQTRCESVKNAIKALPSYIDLVAVHDAARPYADMNLINRTIDVATEKGTAIPVIPIVDSIREIDGKGHSFTRDRNNYVAVQTPQIFKKDILISAYKMTDDLSFTDEASLVEAAGYDIYISEGDINNVKVTFLSDIV